MNVDRAWNWSQGRWNVVVVSLAVLMMGSGCNSVRAWREKYRRQPLLGPRAVVPAPYLKPATLEPAVPADTFIAPEPMMSPLSAMPEPVLPVAEAELPPQPQPDIGLTLPPVVESELLTYTVKRGDTLWDIAHAYGVTYQELAAVNGMDPKATLKTDAVLKIPPGGRFVPPEKRPRIQPQPTPTPKDAQSRRTSKTPPAAPAPLAGDGTYTVKAGDSLWVIARRFRTTTENLRTLNSLDSDVLQVGQVLRIPQQPKGTIAKEEPATKVVPKKVAPEVQKPVLTPVEPVKTAEQTKAVADGVTARAGDEAQPEVQSSPPLVPAPPLAFPKTLEHTVSQGETLEIIAEMYDTTVDGIKKANPGINGNADLTLHMKIQVPYH